MRRYQKHSMASAIALSFGVAACGGGGSGGPQFTPTPTPTPSPTPTPTPTAVVGAPATPTVPNADQFPVAASGGPTMRSHSTTSFPLLQSVMTVPGPTASADNAANSGGATLATNASGNISTDNFRLIVPGLGFDVTMTAGGFYCYSLACGSTGAGTGTTNFELSIPDPYTSNLSWTTYGTWAAFGGGVRFASFVTGYSTPTAAIPTTGSATYTGSATGSVAVPNGPTVNTCWSCLTGNATMQANFGNGNITGSLSNMVANGQPWNNVSLQGTISGGVNAFSGATSVTSAPSGVLSLNSSATGTFAGRFFGPSAQELGAVWTLYDGTKAATGSIGAKTVP